MAQIDEHGAQLRVAEMFGAEALSTANGRDWRVYGTHDGTTFDFEIGDGGFYDVEPGGAMYAGFPWKAALNLGSMAIVEKGVIPNPYLTWKTFQDRDATYCSPGSPNPDFARSYALITYSRMYRQAQNPITT